VLWVSPDDMNKVNQNRARDDKAPVSFGVICSLEGENLDADYSAHLDLELEMLNAERKSLGKESITSEWGSSAVRFDYGKNREGHWKAAHMIEHTEEFMGMLDVCFPDCQHMFVFDNSSGHGAFADNALLAQKMSKGWGGRQPKMHSTTWTDSQGNLRVQHMVFQQGDPEPISKCSARLKKGEAAPGCVGQAKGLHQVLCERGIAEATLAKDITRKSDREEQIMAALEEEGRFLSINAGEAHGQLVFFVPF